MDSPIFFYLLILLTKIIEIKNIKIHLLNDANIACSLEIDNSTDYYFYTSVKDLKVNEQISYFISNEITRFNITYYFLETDNYEDINDSDINKYVFKETSGIVNPEKLFKVIFKTSNKQKGLLLKMRIIGFEKIDSNFFNISRINLTFVESKDLTISIPNNQIYYFYLEYYYFSEYEILVFSSNAKERIKDYKIYPYSPLINWDYETYSYLLFDEERSSSSILEISSIDNEDFFVNIKFLPKKTIMECNNNKYNNIIQIELKPEYYEVFYLINGRNYSYFLREISGKYVASFSYLDEINNIDDVFPDENNAMISFNDNIIHQENKNLILFHFKSINKNPAIFELIAIGEDKKDIIKEGSFGLYYLKEKTNTSIENKNPRGNNILTYIEYFGCKLENDDEIEINFGKNNIINLNKTRNKILFYINLTLLQNQAYSDKNCSLLLIFGKDEIPINLIEESYNNSLLYDTYFQYPKIEEDYHYHFYFYDERNYNINQYLYCTFFYVNSNLIFIHLFGSFDENYNILMNPYNSFEKDNNLTFLMFCHKHPIGKKFYYNIIKYKRKNGILNKFFLTNNYTEYKFDKLTKTTKILIQIITYPNYLKDEYPSLYIGKYAKKLYNYNHIIVASNEIVPKIVINEVDIVLSINYLDNDIDVQSRISKSKADYNITSEKSGIYNLRITPFLYNEEIKYIIHSFDYLIYLLPFEKEKRNFYYERLFENFGGITINTSFVRNASDIFEYTFDAKDKINSSFKYFTIVAKDLKTGFSSYFEIKTCDYIEEDKKKNTLTIVLISVSVFTFLAMVLIIYIIKRRKKQKEIKIEEQEMLMKNL